MTAKPELGITVFSDYICPFCYIGDARLNHLRDEYDVKVNWCFLEIHPETPATGQPVRELGYEPETWRQMMATLQSMAVEENLEFRDHDFTTNSRDALLLAEAAKHHDRETFYRVHELIFRRYFSEGENIGDREVLRSIGTECGMDTGLIERAWTDASFGGWLGQYLRAAQDLQVRATPTFFIGQQRLDGAVPVEQLRHAAQSALVV